MEATVAADNDSEVSFADRQDGTADARKTNKSKTEAQKIVKTEAKAKKSNVTAAGVRSVE